MISQEVCLKHQGVKGMRWGHRKSLEIKNPLPLASFSTMTKVLYDSYKNDTWKKAKPETIVLNNLNTFQNKVFGDRVKSMMANKDSPDKIKDSGSTVKGILVAKCDGEYVVVDGNHRAVASKKQKLSHIKVSVYDVDSDVLKVSADGQTKATAQAKKYVEDWLKG